MSDTSAPPSIKKESSPPSLRRDLEAGHEKPVPEEPGTAPPVTPTLTSWKWAFTLVALYTGALLYGLDTTIAADVQAAVYETFDDISLLPWVGVGFPMASVAVILLYGRLFGLFDIKILMIVSVILFEVGSALCGAAPNMNALIVGRAIAGVGGCGIYIGALTYVSVFGQGPKLALYNASLGLAWGTGAILGPVIGGAFSDSNATWRWAFYINLPLAALCAPVYLFILPRWTFPSGLTTKAKILGLDLVGVFLTAAVFVFFITALTFSGSVYSWNSGTAIALWVVSGVVLLGSIIQQYFSIFTTPQRRIFPGHFLMSRDMVLLATCTACAATAYSVTLYYIPLYFAFTRGDSALESAVRLLPFIIVSIFFVMLAGGSLPAVGRYAPYYTVGGALTIVGTALMFTIRTDTSVARIYGYEILIAAGTGIVFQNAYAVASAKVTMEDKANAIGFINVSQVGLIAIALSVAGCLYQNLGFDFLKDSLAQYNLSDDAIKAALGGLGARSLAGAPPELLQTVVDTVAYTIARVFGMGIAAGALMFVASFLMKQEKLDLKMEGGGG